ncbi:hypothetical protein DHEL01_v206588 [Diaporthe helianthi]|uniref:Uncharacterized protein n=1 Tax=Diaporthe helianthi TaxID=158607 RepID=A0A2P5HXM8_DIAHE|nr:hypothetical protein DHEL01_v206588 [Diaporthe helianthi]
MGQQRGVPESSGLIVGSEPGDHHPRHGAPSSPAAAPADPIIPDKASRAKTTIFVARRKEVGKKGAREGRCMCSLLYGSLLYGVRRE